MPLAGDGPDPSRPAGRFAGSGPAGLPLLLVTLLVAAAVRLLYLREAAGYPNFAVPYRGLDYDLYDGLARRVAAGDLTLGDEAYHYSALYAYFLGGLYAVFGAGPWVSRLAGVTLGLATVGLVYLLGRRLFRSSAVGLIAAAGAALYGPYVVADTSGLKTSLALLLVSLALLLIDSASGRESARRWIAPGVVLGLAFNLVGQLVLFILAFPIWIVLRPPSGPPAAGSGTTPRCDVGAASRAAARRTPQVAAFLSGLALALTPFAARNYTVAGDLVLGRATTGIHFYIGNHRGAWGGYSHVGGVDPTPHGHFFDARRLAEATARRPLSASETSAYWTRKAIDFGRAQPGELLRLLGRKALLLASHYEIPNNEHYGHLARRSALLRALPRISLLLPLGIAGLLLSFWQEPRPGPLLLFALSYSAAVVLTFVTWRYRLPLTLALWLFAGLLLVRAAGWLHERRWPALAIALALVLGVGLVTRVVPLAARIERDLRQAAAKMEASERAAKRGAAAEPGRAAPTPRNPLHPAR